MSPKSQASRRSKSKTKSSKKLQYASFSQRFWANLIDVLILTAIAFIGYKVIFSSGSVEIDINYSISLIEATSQHPTLHLLVTFITAIMAITYTSLYYLILWVAGAGQTLGYRMLNIKLIRDDKKPISYPLAYLRFIASLFSAFFLMLGFFYILYNKQNKTWHDYICHTSVVTD